MKKGFTLIELTAVIILLALISIIGFTTINKAINDKKNNISEAMNKIIYEAANIYISYNQNNYLKIDGNTYCIKLSELTDYELLQTPLVDAVTNKEISLDNYVKLEVNVDEYIYSIENKCEEKR